MADKIIDATVVNKEAKFSKEQQGQVITIALLSGLAGAAAFACLAVMSEILATAAWIIVTIYTFTRVKAEKEAAKTEASDEKK